MKTHISELIFLLIFLVPSLYLKSEVAFASSSEFPQGGTGAKTFFLFSSDLSVFTWLDHNEDGIRQAGEPGISGVTVQLYNQNNNLIRSGTTDSNGMFVFGGIADGTYRIRFGRFSGLVFTHKKIGNDDFNDSDVCPDGYSEFFSLVAGGNMHIAAGYRGNLLVTLGDNISICKGESTVLEPTPYFGKTPFIYQWDNGLGSDMLQIVTPETTTTYNVTATDDWGFTAESQITVKVKNGIGEEKHFSIDEFRSGSTSPTTIISVDHSSPGPSITNDYSENDILGKYREIKLQHLSGNHSASVVIDYNLGQLFISNDANTTSSFSLCYNSNGQGLGADISEFEFFKLRDFALDQGKIDLTITIRDAYGNTASGKTNLPGLGAVVSYEREIYFNSLFGFNNLDLTMIYEMCFEFNSSDPALDYKFGDLFLSVLTDCLPESDPYHLDICLGDTAIVGANVSCTDIIAFEWDNGLGFGQSHLVSPPVTTTYRYYVTDALGCVVSDTVRVEVHHNPVAVLPAEVEICQQESVTLTAEVSAGTEPYSFIWSTGDTTRSITVSPLVDTEYAVTVTDVFNCNSDETNVFVRVFEKPALTTSSTIADCAESNGSASALASGGTEPYTYRWQNGHEGSALNNIPAGTYSVNVTDDKGCSDTATVVVDEKDCTEIGDFVWEDLNFNGIQEPGEPGIPGVMVVLNDANLNPIDTAYTNSGGYYYFLQLMEGDYIVRFYQPNGFLPTKHLVGDPELNSDADPLTGLSALISLDKYEKNYTIDAGYFRYVQIGDRVWDDLDGNGIQDSGEPGIGGFRLELLDCDDNFLDFTLTDDQGYYLFDSLNPGSYNIRFVVNGEYRFTNSYIGTDKELDSNADTSTGLAQCIELLSGDSELSYDAGVFIPAKLGDYVWEDINADGIQDTGESGIGGVGVVLHDCEGNPLDTTYTDSQGYYLFAGLWPGSYKISVILPADHQVSPAKTGTDHSVDSDLLSDGFTACTILMSGQTDLDHDIGLYRYVQIGDWVWDDLDGNGIQDSGEPGIGGFRVELLDCDDNILDFTFTDDQGYYLFDSIDPGSYSIRFVLNGEYRFTTPYAGTDIELDSDADPITGMAQCIELFSGDKDLSYDAGVFIPASLGDYVWLDENGNGIQDDTETGIENVRVDLLDCTGNTLLTQYTDQNGYYIFEDLDPGYFKLKFYNPDDHSFTLQHNGPSDLDSDADTDGFTDCFSLISDETNLFYDAGLIYLGSIGNYVWEDMNGDGIQQYDEPGIPGVSLWLYKWNGSSFVFEKATTTDANGYYLFDLLYTGTYFVKIFPPSGYSVTLPNEGDDPELDSDATNINGVNSTANIYLNPGQNDLSWDFGLFVCATVGDLVWNDDIRNDIFNDGESGINGVKVRLWRKSGEQWEIWDYTYTHINQLSVCGDGYWVFCTNPGEYFVEFSGMENTGFQSVLPHQGDDDEIDSDITHAFGLNTTNSFILKSGDVLTSIDGGFYMERNVSGIAWLDTNADGIRTENETRMEGILVQLFNQDQIIATTVTDESGEFLFEELQADMYYLKFSLPENHIFTIPNAGSNPDIDSDVTFENGPGTTGWFEISDNSPEIERDAGYRDLSPLVPFKFGNIDAFRKEGYNLIEWESFNEEDVSHYNVLRNIGAGEVFDLIEMVNSGRSEKKSYNIRDYDIEKIGNYRYKIKAMMVDSFVYSNEVLIDLNIKMGFSIYPNPASSLLNFEYIAEEDEVISILISDFAHNVYYQENNIQVRGNTKFTRIFDDLASMPDGVFQFVLKVRDEYYTIRFVKFRI